MNIKQHARNIRHTLEISAITGGIKAKLITEADAILKQLSGCKECGVKEPDHVCPKCLHPTCKYHSVDMHSGILCNECAGEIS